jgi:hypothetical protein
MSVDNELAEHLLTFTQVDSLNDLKDSLTGPFSLEDHPSPHSITELVPERRDGSFPIIFCIDDKDEYFIANTELGGISEYDRYRVDIPSNLA